MIAWVDLETTGLIDACAIIEVACIVTDEDYNEVDKYHSLVKPHVNAQFQSKAIEMHEASGLWKECNHSPYAVDIALVDQELDFILSKNQVERKPMILGGSSVHFDQMFIKRYMPLTFNRLHYRLLDVSSVKIFMANLSGVPTEKLPPIKSETKHRAMDDIQDSIQALKIFQAYVLGPLLKEDYDD